jgi:hypothetical protein
MPVSRPQVVDRQARQSRTLHPFVGSQLPDAQLPHLEGSISGFLLSWSASFRTLQVFVRCCNCFGKFELTLPTELGNFAV